MNTAQWTAALDFFGIVLSFLVVGTVLTLAIDRPPRRVRVLPGRSRTIVHGVSPDCGFSSALCLRSPYGRSVSFIKYAPCCRLKVLTCFRVSIGRHTRASTAAPKASALLPALQGCAGGAWSRNRRLVARRHGSVELLRRLGVSPFAVGRSPSARCKTAGCAGAEPCEGSLAAGATVTGR